ncbi:multiple coagulation factor deficiency protein 2 homolog [Lingula anatina]|uniref:Multiple coagulation factor deficiency protein 2 homolog n=1 Tax=Lingula anatina TaxID=7574 RepID=A0A1S3IDI4_LINAN|nr:multiple coagulation factor deficiency protein 2 homolog [Lingula anatina]|eukprot:XP_013395921.1 multiple coagulation factor deficiency protein 2 homolog [Lingula anatina]
MCQGWKQTGATILALALMISLSEAHAGGHGHAPTASGERGSANHFHDPRVVQDAQHIKEHYEGLTDINETALTPEELEFHYFKLHDFDNNSRLDGLEILSALTHFSAREEMEREIDEQKRELHKRQKPVPDDYLHYYTEIVDTVLEEDDLDNDGYLTYAEYVFARRREEANERRDRERREKGPP